MPLLNFGCFIPVLFYCKTPVVKYVFMALVYYARDISDSKQNCQQNLKFSGKNMYKHCKIPNIKFQSHIYNQK